VNVFELRIGRVFDRTIFFPSGIADEEKSNKTYLEHTLEFISLYNITKA
jgi:hypothetical protein